MADVLFGAPPPGGDVDRGPIVYGTYWAFFGICTVVLALRFWARIKIRALGWDDWVMAAAVVLLLALTVAGTEMALAGGCRHVYYLIRQKGIMSVVAAARLFYIAQPFALLGVVMGRISVGLLLLRVIGQSKVRRAVIWTCISTTLVFGLLNVILLFAACRPAEAVWNPFVPGAVCWDPTVVTKVTIAFSAWNVFVDFVLALLPITIFYNLKLSLEKRVGLILLLSGGVFAGVCGAVKAAYLPSANNDDVTWATYDLLLWHGAEYFLVVVLGSLPTLKPIYDLARGRGPLSTHASSSHARSSRGSRFLKKSWGSSNATASTAVQSQPALPRPKPSGISVSHRVDVEAWDDGRGWIELRDGGQGRNLSYPGHERDGRDLPYQGRGGEGRRVEIRGPSRLIQEV